ncbi:MAG: hypothetical protein R3E84_02895 [Pseudomonadales bacterium]
MLHAVLASGRHRSLLLADTRNMNWRLDDTHDRQWLFGDFGGRFVHAPMQIGWPAGTSGSRWLELEVVNPGSRDILLDLAAAEVPTRRSAVLRISRAAGARQIPLRSTRDRERAPAGQYIGNADGRAGAARERSLRRRRHPDHRILVF